MKLSQMLPDDVTKFCGNSRSVFFSFLMLVLCAFSIFFLALNVCQF